MVQIYSVFSNFWSDCGWTLHPWPSYKINFFEQSFSKIKIARTHLFYLSLILFKKNELSEASKKLKEAVAITEMNFQAFVDSEPYKDEENIKKLIQDFHSIENY